MYHNGALHENKVRQAADVETTTPGLLSFPKWWVLFSCVNKLHHYHEDGMSDSIKKKSSQYIRVSGGRRYFRLGWLNDECVRKHVGSRGVWEHFPLENLSQFKALRSLLRSALSQNSSTACSLICCAVFCNRIRPPRDIVCQPSALPLVTQAERAR